MTNDISSRKSYFLARGLSDRDATIHAMAEKADRKTEVAAYAASLGVEVRKSWTVRRIIAEVVR